MSPSEVDALEASLSDDDRRALDELADTIARLRMVAPAMFLFESAAPLARTASVVMTMFEPIVGTLWKDPRRWAAMMRLLDRPGATELMVRRLEARA